MSNLTLTDDIEEEDEEFPLTVTIPCGIIIVCLIFFAVFGNLMTIAAFIRDKGLRNVYNMYLINLAVTDLLLGLVSMPFYAVYTLKSHSWPFGYHFCKTYMVIDFALCLESILTIIVISLDRLLLLRYGPHYSHKETPKVAVLKLALTWIVAVSLYSPAIIGWDLWTGEDSVEQGDCDVQFANDLAFTASTAVVEFAIPFTAIGVLNFLIYCKIRKRSKISPVAKDALPSVTTAVDAKNRKAARFLAMLVVVFGITWAPYTVSTIIISFCDSCVDVNLYEAFNWLLWSKASLNPFLYAYNSARFAKNFQNMLACCKKGKVTDTTSGTATTNSKP